MISATEVQIVTRGDVNGREQRHARDQVAKATRYLRDPILFARVTLTLAGDPANERPAEAEAMLQVRSQPVHATATAPTVREAVDHMHQRLRDQLEHLTDRRLALRARGAQSSDPHAWRHGDRATGRPTHYPRPPDERQVLARTTYAHAPLTAAEAAEQLSLLGYRFHLYRDAATGRDAIVERTATAGTGVRLAPAGDAPQTAVPPVPTLTRDEATRHLDLSGQPWLFFRDRVSGRGAVAYHRYDGHYGVVTAA